MNTNKLEYNENNEFLVIAISGKARHGKDTVSALIEQLCMEEGLSYQRLALARTIKDYAKMLGWDGKEETKPRELLQQLGTEIIRQKLQKPLFHSIRLCDDIEVLSGYKQIFIINDVRFKNELAYIQARFPDNVISIRVVRENFKSDLTDEQLKHKSEIDLDNYNNWDIVLLNNGSIDDLSNQVNNFMKEKILKLKRNDIK